MTGSITVTPVPTLGHGLLLLGGVVALLGLWLAAPAFACAPLEELHVEPQAAPAGAHVEVSGERFETDKVVSIRWDSPEGPVLAVAQQDGGSFTQTVVVPSVASPGHHALFATQYRGGRHVGVSVVFEVLAGPDPTDPETGAGGWCPPGDAPFTDRGAISEVHRVNVDCAATLGVAHGAADGAFQPGRLVRRDQMASSIARALEAAGVRLPTPLAGFRDVPVTSVHNDAIVQLAHLGIVDGLPDGSYGPALPVRRDQMASFLSRAAELVTDETVTSATPAFHDVRAGNVHYENINGAAEAGLVSGFSDRTYRPGSGVRRDQMASYVLRLFELMVQTTAKG